MTTYTVGELDERLRGRHQACTDFKASTADLLVDPETGRGLTFPSGFGGAFDTASMNDHALSQMSERMDVPFRWTIDDGACPPELRSMVFNWKFLKTAPKPLFLRTIANSMPTTMRAILSDRFQPYDHVDLWEAVKAAVSVEATGLGEPKVIVKQVDDELRGYLLWDSIRFDGLQTPRRTQDGGGSGGLSPAVYFGNSEVGTGRVRIASGLYRSYCSNGMIYGWKEEGAIAITHAWSAKAHIAMAVHEGIANALKLSEEAGVRMLAAMDKLIPPTKLDSIFSTWAEKYGLTVESTEQWKAMVRPGPTVFDIVNAATVIAHGEEDAVKVEGLERMAGDMLADLS